MTYPPYTLHVNVSYIYFSFQTSPDLNISIYMLCMFYNKLPVCVCSAILNTQCLVHNTLRGYADKMIMSVLYCTRRCFFKKKLFESVATLCILWYFMLIIRYSTKFIAITNRLCVLVAYIKVL